MAAAIPGRARTAIALVGLALAVVVFARGWNHGEPVLDGPGTVLYVRIALDHWRASGHIPYLTGDLWSGTPVWIEAPSFPVLMLLPVAARYGPERAVEMSILAAQVAGAWGAFALARSMWGKRWTAPFAAGLFYGLSPLFIAHGTLFGSATSVWVIGAVPWLVLALVKTMRAEGPHWVVATGLIAAFCALQQAEHVYGLVVLCACVAGVEAVRARSLHRAEHPDAPAGALAGVGLRLGVAAAVAGGACAFWLVPLQTAKHQFIFSPPGFIADSLADGLAGEVGRNPQYFLHRPGAMLAGPTTYSVDYFRGGVLYLGLTLVLLTLVAAWFLPTRDRHGQVGALVLSGLLCLWTSTATDTYSGGHLAHGGGLVALAVIGLLTGVVVTGLLSGLGWSGRRALGAAAATGAAMVAVPYVAPFTLARNLVPLLDQIRFPRLYPVAVLSVAMAAAWALVLGQDALAARLSRAGDEPPVAPAGSVALAVLALAAFVVDIHPFASLYRLEPPVDRAPYAGAIAQITADPGDYRVASLAYGDPRTSVRALEAGHDLSLGWPHPVAALDYWDVSGAALISPPDMQARVLGLSGSRYLIDEQFGDLVDGRLPPLIEGISNRRNPWALPLARAYERVVTVRDRDGAGELATALAPRNVGLATVGSKGLGAGLEVAAAVGEDPCTARPETLGEVASACSTAAWLGLFREQQLVAADNATGGRFTALANGLRGVHVWSDPTSVLTRLQLVPVATDGVTLGPPIAEVSSAGRDDDGLETFEFPTIPDSAGKTYAFVVSCPRCEPGFPIRVHMFRTDSGKGNAVVNGIATTDRSAAFTAVYDTIPAAPAPTTTVAITHRQDGEWDLESQGGKPALVVAAEAWFPGWRVTVDGERADVVKADAAFLGVVVGPGRHTIRFRFPLPTATVIGRGITALTLVACVPLVLAAPVAAMVRRQRRRRHQRRKRGRSGPAGPDLEVGAPP